MPKKVYIGNGTQRPVTIATFDKNIPSVVIPEYENVSVNIQDDVFDEMMATLTSRPDVYDYRVISHTAPHNGVIWSLTEPIAAVVLSKGTDEERTDPSLRTSKW